MNDQAWHRDELKRYLLRIYLQNPSLLESEIEDYFHNPIHAEARSKGLISVIDDSAYGIHTVINLTPKGLAILDIQPNPTLFQAAKSRMRSRIAAAMRLFAAVE